MDQSSELFLGGRPQWVPVRDRLEGDAEGATGSDGGTDRRERACDTSVQLLGCGSHSEQADADMNGELFPRCADCGREFPPTVDGRLRYEAHRLAEKAIDAAVADTERCATVFTTLGREAVEEKKRASSAKHEEEPF